MQIYLFRLILLEGNILHHLQKRNSTTHTWTLQKSQFLWSSVHEFSFEIR